MSPDNHEALRKDLVQQVEIEVGQKLAHRANIDIDEYLASKPVAERDAEMKALNAELEKRKLLPTLSKEEDFENVDSAKNQKPLGGVVVHDGKISHLDFMDKTSVDAKYDKHGLLIEIDINELTGDTEKLVATPDHKGWRIDGKPYSIKTVSLDQKTGELSLGGGVINETLHMYINKDTEHKD
jgi:hypothetical protein